MTMSGVILFSGSMFVLVVCWLNNPRGEGVAEFLPLLLAHGEFAVVEQAGFQLGEEFFLFEILADEDEHLAAVAVGFLPIFHDRAPGVVVIGPTGFRRGGPPEAGGAVFRAASSLRPEADHGVAAREPEVAFRAEQAGAFGVDEIPEALRVERAAGAEDEAADAVFLGLGRVLVVQLAEPACGGLGFFHVEAAGVEDGSKIYTAALGFDDFRAGIQVVENGAEFLELLFVD